LDKWPERGVSNTNPFTSKKQYDIPVEFELVNQRGKVIGKNTIRLNPPFSIDKNFILRFNTNSSGILTFKEVKTNDISDNLIIRLASVNGASPKTAMFPIVAVSGKEFPEYQIPTRRTAFTDSRDSRKYGAVEIGPQIWMAENLNFNVEGSKCYDNELGCQYGRLYNWNTAMKVCPKGWHLPSGVEWDILTLSVGGDKTAGKYLKATSGWNNNGNGTDKYGFSALPGGYGNSRGSFGDVGDSGYWWSSKENDSNDAYRWYMGYNSESVDRGSSDKSGLRSVRCVQD